MGTVVSLADYREAAKLPLPVPSGESRSAWLNTYIKPASEWRRGWAELQLADYLRNAGYWRMDIAGREHGKGSDAESYAKAQYGQLTDAHETLELKQLFIAAPTVPYYRWKQDRARWFKCPEVTAALARDEVALAPQLDKAARIKAGKARAKAARQAVQS